MKSINKNNDSKEKLIAIFPKELKNEILNTPLELAFDKSVDLNTRIEFLLPFLGFPTSLNGYNYAKDAILMVCEDEKKLKKMTSVLYKEIAEKYNSSATRVERSIRNATEICFSRMNPTLKKWLFGSTVGYQNGKCSNSEFIARISRLLTKI